MSFEVQHYYCYIQEQRPATAAVAATAAATAEQNINKHLGSGGVKSCLMIKKDKKYKCRVGKDSITLFKSGYRRVGKIQQQ